MRTVAALYVDPKGPYPKMLGVQCWTERENANDYPGPYPVVAHPPCGPWGCLSHMRVPNRERRAGDADCARYAVNSVRIFGGVLEQPARSKMFSQFGLPAPGDAEDSYGGRSYYVEQVDWGHVARKATWLYVVRVDPEYVTSKLSERSGSGVVTHWVSGGRKHDRKGSGGIVPDGIRVCSAQQRRRTPLPFAELLVELARRSG